MQLSLRIIRRLFACVNPSRPLGILATGRRMARVDPRNNVGRIGQIIIARGRDTGYVVMSTAFGTAWRQTFRI